MHAGEGCHERDMDEHWGGGVGAFVRAMSGICRHKEVLGVQHIYDTHQAAYDLFCLGFRDHSLGCLCGKILDPPLSRLDGVWNVTRSCLCFALF